LAFFSCGRHVFDIVASFNVGKQRQRRVALPDNALLLLSRLATGILANISIERVIVPRCGGSCFI
jgi:hypothetical protein